MMHGRCLRGLYRVSANRVAAPPRPALLRRCLQILRTVDEVRAARASMAPSATLGFVPTMGALHSGHLDLVHASQSNNSHTLVSIFVNPTQFLPGEDFNKYPRPIENDLKLLREHRVNYVFLPLTENIYGAPPFPVHSTYVTVEGADDSEEGRVRPGHFRGVATVCTKLFNIVQPHTAYFGAKDGQQCIVIKKVVRELNIPIKISVVPTSRESDGLARSSRNIYLSAEDRKLAPVLYQALKQGEAKYHSGERDAATIKRAVSEHIERAGQGKVSLQYVSLVDTMTGAEIDGAIGEGEAGSIAAAATEPDQSFAVNRPNTNASTTIVPHNLPQRIVMLSIAAKVGHTRLIDNITFPPQVKDFNGS